VLKENKKRGVKSDLQFNYFQLNLLCVTNTQYHPFPYLFQEPASSHSKCLTYNDQVNSQLSSRSFYIVIDLIMNHIKVDKAPEKDWRL